MAKVKKALNIEEVQATIKQLVQQTLREALEAELEEFLGYRKYGRSDTDNYRNGYSSKTIKTSSGSLEIKVPRDRNGEFKPQIIKKRQTMLDELEHQIIALYSEAYSKNCVRIYGYFSL